MTCRPDDYPPYPKPDAEPGMRAGYVWCTDALNREKQRDYLLSFGYTHEHEKGGRDAA